MDNTLQPTHGTIMVYDSEPSPKKLFIFDKVLPGNFYRAIDESAQTYLECGKFKQWQVVGISCRPATDEEIQEYHKIVEASAYSNNIKKLIQERSLFYGTN